jgi:ribonuclease BN (tRNA processing enzyme)
MEVHISTQLILLGTAGGPRPNPYRYSTAQVIIVNQAPYVIDAGYGVARQLVLAGVALKQLRHVFITHHHCDHNVDYGALLLLAWCSGLQTHVDTWGPPPLEKMTRLALELHDYDIQIRIVDDGRPPLAPLIHPHEFAEAGLVMQDDHVKVTAALVKHPPVKPAFAYRFDTADRAIVLSGDTTPQDSLLELAAGADVLVHEVFYAPTLEESLRPKIPANYFRSVIRHIHESHTTAEDAGRLAQAAGVKTLVLSHLIPTDDPSITDAMWIAEAKRHFSGEVIVGRDLLTI